MAVAPPATRLIPAPDTTAADWLETERRGFAESVISLVPERFPSYCRIFHPAYRDGMGPVRWEEIAATNGTRAHPTMQLTALTRSRDSYVRPQPGVFDGTPWSGTLPAELISPVVEVLARHTSTPGECWFAVWEGWGALRADIRRAPAFDAPGRRYHLMRGSIAAAAERVGCASSDQTASIWWPEDRTWCVHTEVDLDSTYVGCSAAALADLLAHDALEAFAIDPASQLAYDSDPINPTHAT